jgi:ABC-type Na+ efflux pump permease subunit
MLIIAKKDILETLHSRTTYITLLFLVIIVGPYFTNLSNVLHRGAGLEGLETSVTIYLNNLVCTMPLTVAVLLAGPFSSYSMLLEKAKHTFESLLSTPVTLREVWLGKSLSVFLPCVMVSVTLSLAALAAFNVVFIFPAVGGYIFPDTISLLTGFVFIPVLVFSLVAFISLLQLILNNPRIPIFAFTAIFMAIYFGTVTNAIAGVGLTGIYLVLTAILVAGTLFANRFLTKERVVLSSKG